ncbi:hypothetical protein B0T17DRAFT_612663 [Bombardia bombarda]|uniref:GST C-terminal domain-containing protein n=1 Tax=Bombardia bombarda TaxID=252184 RepID=A0AA39XKT5_9PEZI|nr:hypothetical protein B0T17DRAFT_612663 [Bombardia bombarda]
MADSSSLPKLTLYLASGSCALAPHILLRELAIPFTPFFMRLNIKGGSGYEAEDGSFSAEEYKKTVHHSGYVPALKVVIEATGEEDIITEMPAILTYIASLAPSPERAARLLGATPIARAKTISWLAWLSSTLHGQAYASIWKPKRFVDQAGADVEAIVAQVGRKTVIECYRQMEAALERDGGEFFIGGGEGQPGLVDICAYLFYRWGVKQKFEMGQFVRYEKVAQAVEARESASGAVEREGGKLVFA